MLQSLKVVAGLMLAAGIALGVFAGSLIAHEPEPVRPLLDRTIEHQVALYREYYDLDEDQVARLRLELKAHRARIRAAVHDLYHDRADAFAALRDRAEQRIAEIVGLGPDGELTPDGD